MNKYILNIVFLLVTSSSLSQVTNLVYDGNQLYQEGKYAEADSLYKLAIAEVDSFAPALYNHGLALYRLNEFSSAASQFESIISSGNEEHKANSYFNLGNTRLKQWYKTDATLASLKMDIDNLSQETPEVTQNKMDNFLLKDSLLNTQKKILEDKTKLLDAALESYKNCLRHNPEDNDARYNLVYANKLKPQNEKDNQDKNDQEKQKGASDFAKKIKEQALKLIQENKFTEAYYLMQNAKEKDPSVAEFDKLIQKLEVITKIKEK